MMTARRWSGFCTFASPPLSVVAATAACIISSDPWTVSVHMHQPVSSVGSAFADLRSLHWKKRNDQHFPLGKILIIKETAALTSYTSVGHMWPSISSLSNTASVRLKILFWLNEKSQIKVLIKVWRDRQVNVETSSVLLVQQELMSCRWLFEDTKDDTARRRRRDQSRTQFTRQTQFRLVLTFLVFRRGTERQRGGRERTRQEMYFMAKWAAYATRSRSVVETPREGKSEELGWWEHPSTLMRLSLHSNGGKRRKKRREKKKSHSSTTEKSKLLEQDSFVSLLKSLTILDIFPYSKLIGTHISIVPSADEFFLTPSCEGQRCV